MEKKISFGFSKISKKSNLLPTKTESKVETKGKELIKCLEGQTIKLVETKEEEAPLVIPLKDGGKTSAALLSLRTRKAVLNGEEIAVEEIESKTELPPPELNGNGIEDIEKRAARELLAEINQSDEKDNTGTTLVLPLKAEDLPLDGAKESTIDDYESIPITQFGRAMLRGMGWKDQPKKKVGLIEEGPILRPKGMGLGADKALKSKALLVPPEANEILEIKKGACVLVLGGKNKDLYGQVEGLDEHAGRVIVKMALGGAKESFNEFMVQPVSKKEYSKYSKCINSAKYDEYKRMENEYGQIIQKKENIKDENVDEQSKERNHLKVKNEDEDEDQQRNGYSKDDYKIKPPAHRYSTEPDYNSCKIERRSRSRDRRDEEYAKCSTSRSKDSSRRRRTPSKHRSKSIESVYSSDESVSHRNKYKKKSSKSKKSKKSKDRKHEKRCSSDSSSEDERRHKKKTKKSKRRRSRSRSKVRR